MNANEIFRPLTANEHDCFAGAGPEARITDDLDSDRGSFMMIMDGDGTGGQLELHFEDGNGEQLSFMRSGISRAQAMRLAQRVLDNVDNMSEILEDLCLTRIG
jgi:hypothetical protein